MLVVPLPIFPHGLLIEPAEHRSDSRAEPLEGGGDGVAANGQLGF